MHPRGRIDGRPFGNRQPARTSGRIPGLASTIGNPAASRALLRTRIAHVGRGPSALSRSGAPRGRTEMREQAESRGGEAAMWSSASGDWPLPVAWDSRRSARDEWASRS
jgi:hypothetical protein